MADPASLVTTDGMRNAKNNARRALVGERTPTEALFDPGDEATRLSMAGPMSWRQYLPPDDQCRAIEDVEKWVDCLYIRDLGTCTQPTRITSQLPKHTIIGQSSHFNLKKQIFFRFEQSFFNV
jgi:hypothetical protein